MIKFAEKKEVKLNLIFTNIARVFRVKSLDSERFY